MLKLKVSVLMEGPYQEVRKGRDFDQAQGDQIYQSSLGYYIMRFRQELIDERPEEN